MQANDALLAYNACIIYKVFNSVHCMSMRTRISGCKTVGWIFCNYHLSDYIIFKYIILFSLLYNCPPHNAVKVPSSGVLAAILETRGGLAK